jgi:flagellar motility protein MotE (MotC chaperone)
MKFKTAFPSFLIILATLLFTHSSMPAETVDLTPNGELQEKSLPQSPDAGQLISALEKRKAELDKRAEEIDQENQRLQALKTELNNMLGRYSQERENAKKAKLADTIDANQLVHLTKMYEAMPPKDAAARIQRLREPLALKLLSSIKPKTAAKILNEIKPSKAAHLTERLAKTVPPQQPAAP